MNKNIITIILCASLIGCANFKANVQTVLGPPSQVQSDVDYLGKRAKPYISEAAQAKIHAAAVTLSTTANADLSAIYALFPSSTGSITGDLFINGLKTTLSLVVIQIGSNNPLTLEYLHGIANGVLKNY